METQMGRIADSYNSGTGRYRNLRSGGDYLTGQQAVDIHNDIIAKGGYSSVDVYLARVNNVTTQQVPGTNAYQYAGPTGPDSIRWVQWGSR
jgi:hypothetical protein